MRTVNAVLIVREHDDDESAFELEPVRSRLDEHALLLRRQSMSYRAIAAELGCPVSVAFRRVQRAQSLELQETTDQVRANIAAQLDEAIGRMFEIMSSDKMTRYQAVRAAEQLIRALDRKARLFGADLPVKRFVDVHVVTDAALEEERLHIEAELTARGIDVSALPTPEEIAGRLLASRKPITLPSANNGERP